MRLFFLYRLVCFTAALFFSIPASAQRKAAREFDPADSTQGLVIYSISTTKPAFSNYYLEIFHVEERRKDRLILTSFHVADVKNDTCKVHYNAVMLPNGEYQISGWGLLHNSNKGMKNFFLGGNFSFPFTVSGGRINYLGDYLGIAIQAKDLIGMKVTTGGYFVVSNRFDQDYETIANKWPNLDLNKVLNSMPDFSENKPKRSLVFLKGINIP